MALAVADLFSDLRLESKTHVIENASAADLNLRGGESERRRERIRVVFVGQFTRSKGAAVFAQIVHELGRDRRFSFRAVGGVVDHESLRLARRAGRVRTTGWYQKEWLPELLDAHTDVVTLVSVVPESWSYTLSEVLAAGTPVVAFDFGAVGERLRRAGRQEWLVPREEGAAGFARRLRDYVEGRLRWSPGPVEDPWSFEQSTARYAELYEECAKRFKQDVSSPASGGAR
ncbi:MAG TPA: glycosyltransferase [Thermoanaerobaculia bacterium]|nr:glycosyltransferase [Thermoanaerobaculia bacterium]